jgi:hypothetical protein
MFSIPALAAVDLLLALLRRLIARVCWRQAAAPPATIQRCLMRTEVAPARAIRTTLAESDVAAPDGDDEALVAWFARTHGAGGAPSHAKRFAAFRVQRSNTNDPTPLCRSEPKCLERRRPRRRARLEMVSAERAPPLRACAWPSPPQYRLGARQARPQALAQSAFLCPDTRQLTTLPSAERPHKWAHEFLSHLQHGSCCAGEKRSS